MQEQTRRVVAILTMWVGDAGDRMTWHRASDTENAGPRTRDRGEGIVSVAIAVLIMAALGVVAYGAFDALFNNTTDAAEQQINSIGG